MRFVGPGVMETVDENLRTAPPLHLRLSVCLFLIRWATISSRAATSPWRGWACPTRPRLTSNLHSTLRINASRASTSDVDRASKKKQKKPTQKTRRLEEKEAGTLFGGFVLKNAREAFGVSLWNISTVYILRFQKNIYLALRAATILSRWFSANCVDFWRWFRTNHFSLFTKLNTKSQLLLDSLPCVLIKLWVLFNCTPSRGNSPVLHKAHCKLAGCERQVFVVNSSPATLLTPCGTISSCKLFPVVTLMAEVVYV